MVLNRSLGKRPVKVREMEHGNVLKKALRKVLGCPRRSLPRCTGRGSGRSA
jgi:hypothetical protein